MKFDYIKLEKLVEDGEILKNKHPSKDLYVYSYNKVWYPEWTEELLWARGLVLDSNGNVIACPFKKFFNYSDLEVLDKIQENIKNDVQYKVTEKLDGSLGILFYYDGEWILNTRGSFTSEQAIKGKQILEDKYPEYKDLDERFTYLFEIIYPDNQIVVSYNEEKLVFLAAMNPATMEEIPSKFTFLPICFERVKTFDLSVSSIIEDLKRKDYTNSEGFVVVYDNGLRVKFKYEEYVRLHKIVSDFKPLSVIELMRIGGNIDELINSLPDEFRQDIITVRDYVLSEYNRILNQILIEFKVIYSRDKKTFALNAIKSEYRAHLFEFWKAVEESNEISMFRSPIISSKLNDLLYKTISENFNKEDGIC